MLDLFSSGALTIAAIIAGSLYIILFLRAALKAGIRNNNNISRIRNLEISTARDIDCYSCYSNQDSGNWARAKYSELVDMILESPSIVYHRIIPGHDLGFLYSINIDEETQVIYVAFGSDNYDWSSNLAPQNDRFRKR